MEKKQADIKVKDVVLNVYSAHKLLVRSPTAPYLELMALYDVEITGSGDVFPK